MSVKAVEYGALTDLITCGQRFNFFTLNAVCVEKLGLIDIFLFIFEVPLFISN